MTDKDQRPPPPDEIRCKGRKRSTGERCRLPAAEGSDFCPYHGGGIRRSNAGAPKGTTKPPGSGRGAEEGNVRAMKYGVATTKMPAELVAAREQILAGYLQDVENPNFADQLALRRVATLEVKFQAAAMDLDCPASTLDLHHRTLHRELKAMKATREMREQTGTGTSPAEVIAAIMMKVAERREQLRGGRQIQAPRVVRHTGDDDGQDLDNDCDDGSGSDVGQRGRDDGGICDDAEAWSQEECEGGEEGAQDNDCDDQDADLGEDGGDDDDWFPL